MEGLDVEREAQSCPGVRIFRRPTAVFRRRRKDSRRRPFLDLEASMVKFRPPRFPLRFQQLINKCLDTRPDRKADLDRCIPRRVFFPDDGVAAPYAQVPGRRPHRVHSRSLPETKDRLPVVPERQYGPRVSCTTHRMVELKVS